LLNPRKINRKLERYFIFIENKKGKI